MTEWRHRTMGMPAVIKSDDALTTEDVEAVFYIWQEIDNQFSPYKPDSEVSRVNREEINLDASVEMREVVDKCRLATTQTEGFFDPWHNHRFDPSGLVKGWAIQRGVKLLHDRGYHHFYVEIAGDVYVSGLVEGRMWRLGIKHPFHSDQVVKVVSVSDRGVATSGNYLQQHHIYDPVHDQELGEVVSLTVIGPTIEEADVMATAGFAMGKSGLEFIEKQPEFEAYLIDAQGQAWWTNGFETYVETS